MERRPFVVGIVGFTGLIWIGLCLTDNFEAFCALTFVTGFTTVTPQLSECIIPSELTGFSSILPLGGDDL